MIFGEDRTTLRRMYAEAWKKHRDGAPISPLEAQIADVVAAHPEYHSALQTEKLDEEFTVERGKANPFLHMGLHLGVREQVGTDRPAGIAAIFRDLVARLGDAHDAEHRMIDCLAETLWEAQGRSLPPDEQAYLDRLRRL